MKAYITFHPRDVLAGTYFYEEKICQDFDRLKSSITHRPAVGLPARSTARLGVDSEYAKDGTLLTLAVASQSRAKAWEITEPGWQASAAEAIKAAKVLCGHSVGGDLDHLVKLGLAKESWLQGKDLKDSLLLARMFNENGARGTYGLENLMLDAFNTEPWKAETEKLIKATGNAADWTPEQRAERCRLDAWATVVLANHFEGKLHAVQKL